MFNKLLRRKRKAADFTTEIQGVVFKLARPMMLLGKQIFFLSRASSARGSRSV